VCDYRSKQVDHEWLSNMLRCITINGGIALGLGTG
jgi:hypothetical protein